MKIDNIDNQISLSKILKCNFFNSHLGKRQDAKLTRLIFNSILQLSPLNYKNIDDHKKYSGGFTPEELFYIIHNEIYDSNNQTHKGRLYKINKILKALCKNYKSIYGDRSLLKEFNGSYYIVNFRDDYNRLGYHNMNIGTCHITNNLIKQYNNKVEDYITASIIVKMLDQHIVFNYSQIEKIFGITKPRLKSAFTDLGVVIYSETRQLLPSEKTIFGTCKYSSDEVTDGIVILSYSEKVDKVLEDFNIDLNYNTLLKIRNFIIENKQILKKDSFKNELKTLTYEDYLKIIENDGGREKSKWNRIDNEVTINKGKVIKNQNMLLSGGTKNWNKDNLQVDDIIPKKEKDNSNTVKFIDYNEFCKISRNDFVKYVTERRNLYAWRNFRKEAIEIVKDNEIIIDKEKIISSYECLEQDIDILTSPLFFEDWRAYGKYDDKMLHLFYSSLAHHYTEHVIENGISELELAGITNVIDDNFRNDILTFSEEAYISLLRKEIGDIELSRCQEINIQGRMDYLASIKKIKVELPTMNQLDCIIHVLEQEYNNIDEMYDYAYNMWSINNGDYSTYYRNIKNEIEKRNYVILHQAFNKRDEYNETVNKNIDMLLNAKKPERVKPSVDIEKQLTEALAAKGLSVKNSLTLANTIKVESMWIRLKKKTIEQVVKEQLSAIYN